MTARARLITACSPRSWLSTSASRQLTILGLESSADDTCAAIVRSDRTILANVVLKQAAVHETFGGIHPMYAMEAHQRAMPRAIQEALNVSGLSLGDLDGIAVTRGPGMFGCLSVCNGAGKALAAATGLPLLAVHHMQAHALTPFLTEDNPPAFPFLVLLVSGGHTLLLLARSESDFKVLATTQDESIGGAFDKAARDLAIPWSLGGGSPGAALEAYADFKSSPLLTPTSDPFVVPLRNTLAFSFSGLRSALTRILVKEPQETMSPNRKRELVRGYMGSAVSQLEDTVKSALKWWESRNETGERLGGLVCSGGVASNLFLRARLRSKLDGLGYEDMRLIFPPPHLCTDNAAMIAWVGIGRMQRGVIDDLSAMQIAKWTIEECESFVGRDSK